MNANALLADLAVGMPDDVARAYENGMFSAARACIDAHLHAGVLPQAAQNALLARREMMRRLPDNYTLSRADALALLRREVPDLRDEEFDALCAEGFIDGRRIEGEFCCHDRFLQSLRLYPALHARGLAAPDKGPDVRGAALAAMQRDGHLDADITLRVTIAPPDGADPDAVFCAWLPYPAEDAPQSGVTLLGATPGAQLAAPDAPQRTIYWQRRAGDGPCSVTYRYHIHAPYVDVARLRVDAEQPRFYTHEEAPHLLFTPWLRALADELTAGKTDPLQKARAIYDYVTTRVRYRYQPDYICLEPIADWVAKNGWADCGMFSLLFIALCRIAGIPARWQSGLYVTPQEASPHDWAQFYIAPHGWLWADCSFGAGAHRLGDEARRQHYFGNLDPLRMAANRSFFAQLTPPCEAWRNDPYDKQTGEATLNGAPVHDAPRTREVLAFVPGAPL